MFNVFGSKKQEEKKPTPQINLNETSARLENNIGDIKLKLENTDKELKSALEALKQARTPMQKAQAKQKAGNILKKKKMYEAHYNNLSTTQISVESASIQTQMMKDNMDVMTTLKGTVELQKEMMKGMNPDEVYDIMDDLKDIQEQQEEMNEAFTRNYEIDVGDDELDAELDELDYQMRVELDGKQFSVPNNRVPSKKEVDEKELNDMLKN